jgi:hypothetical protein
MVYRPRLVILSLIISTPDLNVLRMRLVLKFCKLKVRFQTIKLITENVSFESACVFFFFFKMQFKKRRKICIHEKCIILKAN